MHLTVPNNYSAHSHACFLLIIFQVLPHSFVWKHQLGLSACKTQCCLALLCGEGNGVSLTHVQLDYVDLQQK